MYRFLIAFPIVLVMFVSCQHGNTLLGSAMDDAESNLEDNPELSLAILDSIRVEDLHSDKESARYALLQSIALDKNYIDTTSFNVIQPALDYYPKHGTVNERIKTFYYQGRIYQNAGDRDNAMKCFIEALDLANSASDSLTIARTLIAQSVIFKSVYNIDAYTTNQLRAAQIYQQLDGRQEQRMDCLLNALDGALLQDNKALSDSLYNLCKRNQDKAPDFATYQLSYYLTFGTKAQIENAIEAVKQNQDNSYDAWLNIANAYDRIGRYGDALSLLDNIDPDGDDFISLKYNAIKVSVYEHLGDYKKAFSTDKIFSHQLDSIHDLLFKGQLQFSNERHSLELETVKVSAEKQTLIWKSVGIALILLMTIGLLLFILKNNRAKHEKLLLVAENLRHQIVILEHERDQLLDGQSEMPEEVQMVIKERIEMLNSLLASYISSNEQYEHTYDSWVESLVTNTENFMNNNRIAFQGSHPRFIKYFEDHGLTTDEINYVCLYAIGLKGKEVGLYIKKPGHVNISSAIRKKLGIDKHETNIGIYVRRLLKSL